MEDMSIASTVILELHQSFKLCTYVVWNNYTDSIRFAFRAQYQSDQTQ